jgi:Helitron helicase-like domain at N-terminus
MGAHFFDFMMQMFIKHVLGIKIDHRGLYGDTSAYYRTVEQQGRLSLHMHMLLWIKGGVSPDEICCRTRDPNSVFRKSLVQYLKSVHAREFMTGCKEEVKENVNAASTCTDYCDPTETMPEPPPPACQISDYSNCEHCGALASWWAHFKMTVDNLLLRSNIHKCTTNKNKDGSQNQARTFKGCLDNVWGKCQTRFPQPTFDKTEVDEETGPINMKKHELWLNSFSYVVTYLFRCNTDITSLCSGTTIKGVLLYISNYVTKLPLKTHIVLNTICSVFQKNPEMVGGCDVRNDNARKLMMKIVNTLSTKMEMGSPMICMYLLGLPDHYTSHKFRTVFWQSFVQECRKHWVRAEEGTAGACDSDLSDKVAL